MTWKNFDNVNEVITYLEANDPNTLTDLRKQFNNNPVLKEGVTLGLQEHTPKQDEIIVRVTLCKKALESVLKKCNEYQPVLKRKLKLHGNVQLASQLLIIFSGASLMTAVSETYPVLRYISGGLTLLGSLLTLFVQFKSGVLSNSPSSVTASYDKLIDSKFDAEQQSVELDLAFKAYDGTNPQRLLDAITRVNDICLEAKKLLEKITLIV